MLVEFWLLLFIHGGALIWTKIQYTYAAISTFTGQHFRIACAASLGHAVIIVENCKTETDIGNTVVKEHMQ